MAWCRPGDKPLTEPMMVRLLTRICVNWPQWVLFYPLQPCMVIYWIVLWRKAIIHCRLIISSRGHGIGYVTWPTFPQLGLIRTATLIQSLWDDAKLKYTIYVYFIRFITSKVSDFIYKEESPMKTIYVPCSRLWFIFHCYIKTRENGLSQWNKTLHKQRLL